MNFICDKYLYYCIVGDFNLPDLYEVLRGSCQCPNMLKEIFDLILSHSLNQCVHSPTRGENFLDLIFFSQFLDVGATEISVPFSTSDHNSIISNILINFEANHSDIRLVHKNFKASNFDEFNRYLSSINWSNIFDDAESVNDLWTKFCDVLNLGIEKFVPDHVECCNSKRVLYPLYIRKMLLKKKQLWRQRYNANGGNGYKCYSLKCKVAIDKYHERREMAYLRVKNKNFYNFLNNRLRSNAKVPHMQNQNGTKDTDSINIANGFLNEFKNYFIKDNGTLPELKIKNPPDDSIQAVEITPQIVLKHMSSMNKQSAAGPDGLPGCLWFGLRYSACDPLSIIFNKSMIMGKLPDVWKKSIISLIFKKGDKSVYANYRPVALTSVACKIMESVLRDYILAYLTKYKLINKCQHGFLKNHSTGCQLLECLENWTMAVENKMNIDICYIDFSKAFDSVSIPKLIYKLSKYGLRENLLNWLTDYLSNRKFCVRINDAVSDTIEQISGVPEGSVLGPICFVLYINDLPDNVTYSTCKMYADDVKLYCIYSDNKDCKKLQTDINNIANWAANWQLTISLSKTVMLHIGNKNVRHAYELNNNVIKSVTSVKDLGVYVSDNLSWRLHCTETAKRACKVANIILHSFASKSIKVYMKAFDTYVMPILEYCCFIWLPALVTDVNIIENVLRNFTRRAFYKCGIARMSYSDRLKYVKHDYVSQRHLLLSLCMFFNIFKRYVTCSVLDNFIATSQMYGFNLRRENHSLFLSFCKLLLRKAFFTYKLVPIWNILPANFVSTNVTKAFMNYLRTFDLSKFYRIP